MPNRLHAPPDSDQDPRFAIVEGAPALLWLGDVEGRCVYLSRALREFWGLGPNLAEFSWAETVHPDDRVKLAEPFTAAMASHAPFQVEARYRRADGAWRVLRTTAQPRFSPSNQFLGMVGVNVDVTDQRTAEDALRQTADHLEFALDAAAGVGTWVWTLPENRVRGDRRFVEALGLSATDLRDGVSFDRLLDAVDPQDRDSLLNRVSEALATGEILRAEHRVATPDGKRWLLSIGRCEKDAQGIPVRFAGVTIDISERRAREDQLELLTREHAHRNRNIFTVLAGMTRLVARHDLAAAPALADLEARIRAMAAAYAHITPSLDTPSRKTGLRQMLEQLFAPFQEPGRGRITSVVPDLSVGAKAASFLALILHELATNAAKYGALSHAGQVHVEVRSCPDEKIELCWTETGTASSVVPPTSRGFGSQMIDMSAASLGAEVTSEWRPDGLVWRMVVPAESLS